MIIFDNHLHLRRDGQYLEAVKDFIRTGGTHFVLCQYPMVDQVINDKSYDAVFQKTVDMAHEIQQQLDVTVFTTVGPYPVDFIKLKEKFGRKHFPVDQEIMNDSNHILSYGMKQAKEVGVPVILHTETTTSDQCNELVEMGKKVGLSADKIVKHFSPPLILSEENYGLMPSVLASKKNIRKAIKKGTRFMMETDYIDDPKRPGAVLGPKTVPRRTHELLEKDLATEKDVYKIHKENPEKTYGITLDE